MVASVTDIQSNEDFKPHDSGDRQPLRGKRLLAIGAIGAFAIAGLVTKWVTESTGSHVAPQGIEAAAGPAPLLDGTGQEVLTNTDGSLDDAVLYAGAEFHAATSSKSPVVYKVKPGQVGLIRRVQRIANSGWLISTYEDDATGQSQVVYFDTAAPGSQTKSGSTASYTVYQSAGYSDYKPTWDPLTNTLTVNENPVGEVSMMTSEQANAQLIEDGLITPPPQYSVTA